ncbi:CLUMA_CG015541, isoform A [Clunio marinus]|uniref:CLUMA_CG015541, isoform A n=1 Tax=Clunio marinus TaxID=568069 RepID=A0A1J1ITG4_9DIPT|nr:CLUMA_CG015541, isoform A [Clunio marinus]
MITEYLDISTCKKHLLYVVWKKSAEAACRPVSKKPKAITFLENFKISSFDIFDINLIKILMKFHPYAVIRN